MKKFLVFPLISLVFLSSISFSFELKYGLSTNNIYRLKVYTKQDIYIDGVYFRTVEGMAKITYQPYAYREIDGQRYVEVKYLFYYMNRKSPTDEYKLAKVDEVSFLVGWLGDIVLLDKSSSLPPKRGIPSFFSGFAAKGYKWQSRGEEVYTEKDEVVKVPVIVNYSVDDIFMKEGKNFVSFEASYNYYYSVPAGKYLKSLKVSSSIKYNWDAIEGIFSEYREIFDITKEFLPGYAYSSTRHQGTSLGIMEIIPIDIAKQYKLAREIEKFVSNVQVSPPENNEIKVNISDILFDTGSYEVKPSYRDMIVKLAEIIRQYNEVDVVVEGHTDDVGSRDFNITLSENRARSVAKLLIENGVSKNKVSYVGYGPDKPIVPNTSDENRAKNRRVEIKLIWGK
jgi:outer membrane protein OmpA-like peptidoglycan-associated protein